MQSDRNLDSAKPKMGDKKSLEQSFAEIDRRLGRAKPFCQESSSLLRLTKRDKRRPALVIWLAILILAIGIGGYWRYRNYPQLSDRNVELLARVLMSEASIGTDAERRAVGLTVINRMELEGTNRVSKVVKVGGFYHYATNQDPTLYPEYFQLAEQLLAGQIEDFTDGATHFFSPHSMPKKGQSTAGFDCEGGLSRYRNPVSASAERICTPGWSKTLEYVYLEDRNVRPYYFEFYR
ncbi:hypothetical protein Pse7367_0078 [Thalassoporum mexicanum PCC 7367]|uniref:cell wall hydrolase n=1 Tax=Thalassoporum mexicanum TaxID=3457544 RepID=UPI00029FFB13|nr:cell wall hydrolase [Pseudanabaena sp. PCC 7367]AFY68396.1 hypothetical protein Pse7367_0078 [Pseudanabaena sp. PCC 7367]